MISGEIHYIKNGPLDRLRRGRERPMADSQETKEVVRGGLEPPTHGFSIHCSTN